MEASNTEQAPTTQTSSVTDRPHVIRPRPGHTLLKTPRRRSWSSYVSRVDRNHMDSCSCWVLIITSIGVFFTFLLIYARKVCMLTFLVSTAFLTLFVLFFEPPDGKLRRAALLNLLFGPENKQDAEVEKTEPEGLKVKDKQSVRSPLRRASMMYQRYDEVHIPIPVGSPPRGTGSRGTFLKRFWKSLYERRLQVNPYYTTITEESTEEGVNVKKEASAEDNRFISKTLEEIENVLASKRKIVFGSLDRDNDKGDLRSRKLPSPLKKSAGDIDLTRAAKMNQAVPMYASPSFSGLKPLKMAIKGHTVPKLGSKVRGLDNPTLRVYDEGSPRLTTTVATVNEFWKVASSSIDVVDGGTREIIKVPKVEAQERGFRQCHSVSELEESGCQKSRTYLVRGERSFRKVYHVWSM